ncbi:hypothetical protein AB0F03_31940 [Streptomyces sp. NPDC028722]
MEERGASFDALMYGGALREWWSGVIVIAVFLIFAVVWRIRNR